MACLLHHVHFWTLKALSPGTGTGSDIGTHSYHDKLTASSIIKADDIGTTSRIEWAEGRGITWTPRNKPDRLRARLKECEELLSRHAPVCVKWKALKHCLVLLKNGVLVTITVARHSGDIERLTIDRSLVTRIPSNIDAAAIGETSILLSLAEDHRPAILSLQTKKLTGSPLPLSLTQTDSGKKLEKLSTVDPKLDFAHVRGLPMAGIWKHVRLNTIGDLAVFWWRERSSHSHTTHNLLLFAIQNGKLNYIGGVHTDYQPVDIQFSKKYYRKLYCLERVSRTVYLSSTYECRQNELSIKSSESEISLSGNVVVCERSMDENKIMMACEDGTIVIHDVNGGKTITTQSFIKPIYLVRWHPAGGFAFILSSRGELQAFDVGLNPLMFQLHSEEPSQQTLILSLNSHMLGAVRLLKAEWGSGPREGEGHGGCYDNFIMIFENGPMVLLRLELGVLSRGCVGPVEIVCEHLRHGDVEKAVKILQMLSWLHQPLEAYSTLSLILNHTLKLPLTANTIAQMDETFAVFLGREKSLPQQAHKDSVCKLARRYFFLLFRNGWLEKCLELGEMLKARDLVMDVHFRAIQLGLDSLAAAAKQTAERIYQSEDSLSLELCGGSLGSSFTSDQLKLLSLVSNTDPPPPTSFSPTEPRLLGGWDEGEEEEEEEYGVEGKDAGEERPQGTLRITDRFAMKFDDYSSGSEMMGNSLPEDDLSLLDNEKTPDAGSQLDQTSTLRRQ